LYHALVLDALCFVGRFPSGGQHKPVRAKGLAVCFIFDAQSTLLALKFTHACFMAVLGILSAFRLAYAASHYFRAFSRSCSHNMRMLRTKTRSARRETMAREGIFWPNSTAMRTQSSRS
jgi:hypothetical protein